MAQLVFEAIGTRWQIDIPDPLPESPERLLAEIQERVESFDKAYSRFRKDSLVTAMSKEAGTYVLPDDAEPMLSLYASVYGKTGGKVTPLIGRLLSDAGYDAEYSLSRKGELSSPPAWEGILSYRHPELSLSEPALLDFGAAGKGYLIDIIGELLEEKGIRSYCVDAGGDIRHRDAKGAPLQVGLEHPRHFDQVIGVASLGNASLCGSAGNRRAWEGYTHFMDPQTCSSPNRVLACWTVAETTLLADMMATALFFVPAVSLSFHYDFEYLVVYADLSMESSGNFPGEVFAA